jgi:beta-glucosidase
MCCRRDGFVLQGDTGFTACDHYNRYAEDVKMMAEIGLQAYRLSVMWPRVIPEGTGAVNEAGLAFYDRVIDALLEAGIEPWITLFHWDYPLALFHRGGWLNDDASDWFAEYTRVLVDRYSDRVSNWFTLNEPACFIGLGMQDGIHAPGLQLELKQVNRAWHNSLLAHGKAVQVIRSHGKKPAKIGAAPCFTSFRPETESDADVAAAKAMFFSANSKDMWNVTWGMDPILKGAYPADCLELFGEAAPVVKDGDMEVISSPIDFFGFNCYNSATVRAGADGQPEVVGYANDYPHTDMDWPVTPDCLYWTPKFLQERYNKPIIITENGMAGIDWVGVDGKVHDGARIDFLTRHLMGIRRAIADGVDMRGYFQWSIMDNFEWSFGYNRRFGIVHVDYRTQARTIKDSGHWYGTVIRSNGECLPEGSPLDGYPAPRG